MMGAVMSAELVPSSRPAALTPSAAQAAAEASTTPSVDRLSALLDRFRVRASLFHAGPLCGNTRFDARPGRAFLHVLRRGSMTVRHSGGGGPPRRLQVTTPSLLLYPRPLQHVFVNPPHEGSDFSCATLDFDGGDHHPLVQALPPLVCLPLDAVAGLQPALDLLFSETERLRCGSRLLADRLFEVVLIQLLRWIIDHPVEAGVPRGLLTGLADPRLARVLVALHQAPGESWTLPRLAALAGMSRSAFAEAFRSGTGHTPAAYVTDWRLSVAASMLRNGQPVKRIAAELGFATPSSLAKAFRQRLGCTPRQWASGAGTVEGEV